ncbi:hypothetical protein PpBr36_07838 [Pyricularia pennisetigena]|uniref:hypothetical protein n=1 Tax=Pyricularia pennisetigena TaxID=1578925 RepID=UPI0011529ECB|nr:hypothetical protein PpBr36_07838 [Pyricularia pennisetigena]TLS25505.1 hypothetical protein PpBr36_07838 [Pyricularia pennisetigena]
MRFTIAVLAAASLATSAAAAPLNIFEVFTEGRSCSGAEYTCGKLFDSKQTYVCQNGKFRKGAKCANSCSKSGEGVVCDL